MRRAKKVISGVMSFCIAVSGIITGIVGSTVNVSADSGTEWGVVSGILDDYLGVYTEDTKLGSQWNTTYSPDGPLMGNGTVYAFMAGDQKVQNLYISHSNMWQDRVSNNGQEYTTFGGITIKEANKNLALNKAVTASSYNSDTEKPAALVDGNTSTKWCSTVAKNNGSSTYWAVVDLGEQMDVARWMVRHAQAGGEVSSFNTRDFKLQYSEKENPDGAVEEDWIDIDVVEGSNVAVTDRNLEEAVNARYVRLLVTKATQDSNNAVRIYEFELYKDQKIVGQEFRYEQDMKNAEVTAQSEQGFTTKTWLSAKENIIVTEITNVTENSIPMEVSAWTANSNTTAAVDEDTMIVTKTGVSKPSDRVSGNGTWEGWNVNVAMASQIIDDIDKTTVKTGDAKDVTSFVLEPGQTVTLVSAVEGGKEDGSENTLEQAIEKAVQKVSTRTTSDALAEAKQRHREYWKDYWLKSYIDIQDSDVERMYYGMLYQLGCSTSVSSENNGQVAAGLFPWTAADHPAWQGDYTTNTDFQRQIHPLVNANRTEGIQNYLNIIKQYWPEAERRSSSAQHLNWVIQGTSRPYQFTAGIEGGALFPTHIGPWGASTEQYNNKNEYWNSPADATSVLMPVIKMWKYNQDEELLEELYPLMKSVSIFWENYVTLENGKYVVYGATHEGVTGRNPILDVDACKYMLDNTVKAAKQLGVDSDKIGIWQDIIDNMSDVPTMQYNGKITICDVEGRTQASPGYTFNSNPVTIQSVYYFDSIGMSASEEEKEKYINYLDVKNGMGSHRRLISATRLGYDINEIIEQLKSGSINKTPSDWSGIRGNNTIGDIGATGSLAIVQDSLIQSNEGFINIFANWFDNQSASFRRLATEDAFLVDADQNEFGQVTYANIYSQKGRECSVLNPWTGQEMEVYEDGTLISVEKEENTLGMVYTFQTKAGSNYELRIAGKLDGILKLDTTEAELKIGDTLSLRATTNLQDAVISWTSSDMETTMVSGDGKVMALKEGTAVITAAIADTELTAECSVSVTADSGENVAPNGTATSSSHHENLTAGRAISGNWIPGYEGWVSANESWNNQNSRWLQIDLGQEYTIDRWILRHHGHRSQNSEDPIGDPNEAGNWGDYYLQVSPDGVDGWETIDSKLDNKNNTTDQTLSEPVTGRYFRIYMEFPMFKSSAGWQWASGYARLNQVELYAVAGASNTFDVAEIDSIESQSVGLGTAFEELNLPEKSRVRLSNDVWIDFDVEWNAEDYDGTAAGTYTLNGSLKLPAAVGNPENLQVRAVVVVEGSSTSEADKTALHELVGLCEVLDEADYTADSWSDFAEWLAYAQDVLADSSASQGATDFAYVMLEIYYDLLEPVEAPVDKDDLKFFIDYAEELEASGILEKVPSGVKTNFLAALQNAKEVYDNPDATADDVEEAMKDLADAITSVGILVGDKTMLQQFYNACLKLNLKEYEKGTEKEAFKDAMAASLEVLNEPDALQEDINDAFNELVEARRNLKKLNPGSLETMISIAEDIKENSDLYVDKGKPELEVALEEAIKVLNLEDKTQKEIDDAREALREAITVMRMKANKEALEALYTKADGLNLSKYTQKSVDNLKSVMAQALVTLENDELSSDDQKQLDDTYELLQKAIGDLEPDEEQPGDNDETEPKEPSTNDDETEPEEPSTNDDETEPKDSSTNDDKTDPKEPSTNNDKNKPSATPSATVGGKTSTTTTSSPKTGDNTMIGISVLLMGMSIAGIAGVVVIKRRKANRYGAEAGLTADKDNLYKK